MRQVIFSLQLILLIFAFAAATVFAAGEVDPTFNPGLMIEQISSTSGSRVERFFVQTDGKVLIAGRFGAVGKIDTNSVARLNADGTIDQTFHAPRVTFFTSQFSILAIAVQLDGKILIGGSVASVAGQNRTGIARLNADGSLDTSFNPVFGFGSDFSVPLVYDIKITADNKIFVAGSITYNSGTGRNIVRLNADGTIDPTFNLSPAVNTTARSGRRVELLPDGKIFFADGGTGTNLYRLNGDGSTDSSFNTITFSSDVSAIKLLADGKILVGGYFTQVNGFLLRNLVRLNGDGTIDLSYAGNSAPNGGVFRIEFLPNNQLLIGGSFTTYNNIGRKVLAKLNADGTLDDSVIFQGDMSATDFALLQNGRIILGGQASNPSGVGTIVRPALLKLYADGSVDAAQTLVGDPGIVYKVYVQPDRKILIGGYFTHADEQRRQTLVRYNSDGSPDASFNPPVLGIVLNLDVRADGKILVSGGGTVVRLNADGTGSLTMGGSSQSYDAKFLPDGGAVFTAGTVRLRRAKESGTFDSTLDVIANAAIRRILVQPDGKIIVVGDFTVIGGATRSRIARVNPDGTIDQTFNPTGGPNNSIYDAFLQPDGKIVIGGNFTGVNFNTNYKYVARLNSDGTLDTAFNPAIEGGVLSLRLQPNGKILVGGGIYLVGGVPRGKIARINSDGTLDASFDAGAGADDVVSTIDVQTNGRIIIGGSFKRVNNFDRLGVARLFDVATTRTPYDFDGDGRADISVFRPSNGTWYLQQSTNGFIGYAFGANGDAITPGDYDGDGKADIAVFRPSNGVWYIQRSAQGFTASAFGTAGDVPMPGDFDGDGKADLAVFRPSNNTWYLQQSTNGFTGITFGENGDKPIAADYDGDGKTDIAVFRPSNGTWYLLRSQLGFNIIPFGAGTDNPVPADYDGDGKADIAVFRPSTGYWYTSTNPATNYGATLFGQAGDLPVPADYDGDGKADLAVFRPSNGVWYLQRSTQGFTGVLFGISEDKPAPNAFIR